jgi:isochorismate pyruvate lyase
MKSTLQSIRHEIDNIDEHILVLLRERQDYVVSAAQFKHREKGEDGVIVPSRIKSMLEDRARKAKELGLDEEFVEKLFRLTIEHTIELEMKRWREYDHSKV